MLIDRLPCPCSQFQKNYKMGKVLATPSCFVLLAQQHGQKQWWLQWKQANTFIEMKASHLSLLLKWKLVSTTTKEKGPWAPYPLFTQEKTVTRVTLINNGCVPSVGPRYDQPDLHGDIKEPAQSCWLQIDKTWDRRQEIEIKQSKEQTFRTTLSSQHVSPYLSPESSRWVGWENWETLKSVALRGSSFSDHSVQLISSENRSQLMGNDRFWKQALLMFSNKWAVKLMVHTRFPGPLSAAFPQNLFLFSWLSPSWRKSLLVTHMFHQLCFLHHPEPQIAPAGASALSISAAEVEISWQPIAWNRHTGRVLGYEVRQLVLVSDTLQMSLSWPHLYAGASSVTWLPLATFHLR